MSNGRHGVGGPVVGEVDGEYHYDHKHSILEWQLPVIDSSNKSGSMEFSISGHPGDFFPVSVSFASTKSYCDLKVCYLMVFFFHFQVPTFMETGKVVLTFNAVDEIISNTFL